MDGGKSQRSKRLHPKDFKKKQQYKDSMVASEKPRVVPQQPIPDDLLDDKDDLPIESGENFKDLIAHSSVGGGLVLKAEREWSKDINLGTGSEQFADYFNLDVQQLAEAMSQIPFHERFDLSDVEIADHLKDMFTMQANEKLKSVRSRGPDREIPLELSKRDVPSAAILLKMELPLKIDDPVGELTSDPVLDSKEDIQGWLDNVLDI